MLQITSERSEQASHEQVIDKMINTFAGENERYYQAAQQIRYEGRRASDGEGFYIAVLNWGIETGIFYAQPEAIALCLKKISPDHPVYGLWNGGGMLCQAMYEKLGELRKSPQADQKEIHDLEKSMRTLAQAALINRS